MARDAGSALIGRGGSARDDWPLVGRSNEISQLKTSISSRRGAVITGRAGVGKTVLAILGVEFGREQAMAVALVSGTEVARPYPFGAFASLLHRDSDLVGPESHPDQLRRYMHELLDDAGPRPLLVFVDDAHLLDDGSASLVHQLVQAGAATVLACVLSPSRASQPAADPMVVLWKDYGAARIELGLLDGQAIEDLLLAVLGGPVDTVSLRQFAERSLGDPLFLHELVAGSLETGSLREESGIWRLRGALQPTPRLVELVSTRLGALSDAERHALDLTAIGEPLAQPALDQLADAEAIAALEDRGLLTSRLDGRRLQVCLAHPVYGDVVRSGISPRRQRVLARELAEASGGRRQDDTLLLAQLALVSGNGSPDLLVAGAKAARERHDYALAERLGRAAMESGEDFEARLLAAEAADMRGRHEQAALELDALAHDAADIGQRVRVALLRFDHELRLRGTADGATLDALLATELDPVWRDELIARRLCLEGRTSGPAAVVRAVESLRETSAVPRTSLHALLGECLTRSGRMNQALAFLVPPSGATVRQGSTVLSEPWSPFGDHALCLIWLGRMGDAEALLTAAQEELAAHEGLQESAVVAASLAELRLEQGRVQGAFLQATSAAAVFLDLSLPVSARWCEALSAHALALAGVAPKASQTLAALDALDLPTDMRYEVAVLQARAWAWAAGGDMGTARKTLEAAVDAGKEAGDLVGATKALHGLARMGRARQVVDDMGALAGQVDGELTAARFAYVVAAADKDSHALGAAAARFENLGALLYAAEALGEAAVHLRRDGATREAAATQQSAARLLARCEGAVTPFVRAIGARAQLTPAELDTALQAAAGSTDKQIAELMHLSVRTVENRLHRAYQKLGISHRRELVEALRDLPAA
ncbi:MAG TPA: AAA family ATPase [Acidimicrobiales bacterium]|nr:AAA family ATPase [Acidimicrobiales bacterium]